MVAIFDKFATEQALPMMKIRNVCYLLALFLPAALFSCRGDGGRQNNTGAPQQNAPLPLNKQGLITHAGLLPEIIDYEGQFRQAAQWPGQGSTWYAIASYYEQGESFTPSRVSRLNIYLFEIGAGQVLSRRAFRAEAPNDHSSIDLKPGHSQVVSLPSTGTAFSIAYTTCPEGGGACSFHSSVIGEQAKYDFQVLEGVGKSVYFDERAKMMEGIPEDVQEHILEQLFKE